MQVRTKQYSYIDIKRIRESGLYFHLVQLGYVQGYNNNMSYLTHDTQSRM